MQSELIRGRCVEREILLHTLLFLSLGLRSPSRTPSSFCFSMLLLKGRKRAQLRQET